MNGIMRYLLIVTVMYCCVPLIASPPDKPLTSKEWTSRLKLGAWMIFDWGGEKRIDRKIPVTDKAFKTLRSIGVDGGRLHVSDPFNELWDPKTYMFSKEAMINIEKSIDLSLKYNMTVMMQFDTTSREDHHAAVEALEAKDYKKARHYVMNMMMSTLKTWEQCSKQFKDKSYAFTMGPFIECHIFDDWLIHKDKLNLNKEFPWLKKIHIPPEDERDNKTKQALVRQALNYFYDQMCVIYRKYNPKRVIGFKPYGVASPKGANFSKRGGVECREIDKIPIPAAELTFPFGEDKDTKYQIAIMPSSHTARFFWDWNVNNYLSNQEVVNYGWRGVQAALKWRSETGIEIFNDHGYWYHFKSGYEDALAHAQKKGMADPKVVSIRQSKLALYYFLKEFATHRYPYGSVQIAKFMNRDGSLKLDDDNGKAIIEAISAAAKEIGTL